MNLKALVAACCMVVSGVASAGNWSVDSTKDNSVNLTIGSFSSVAALSNVVVSFDFFVSNSGTWAVPATSTLNLLPGGGSASIVSSGSTGGASLLDDPDLAGGSFYHYTSSFSGLTAGSYTAQLLGDDGFKKVAVTNFAATVTAVPEPETYAMMLAGLGAVGFMARRRKTK